ncbi:MAG TPA: alpha/beta fold hydrolase [Gemmatimonadales bacterium]|nr:alpha/beta fold hydrolase [Gemmatimonadales bacterium]
MRCEIRAAGGARPAVVICHGFKGFKDWGFFPVAADRLAQAGFAAVTFNFSGSGVGEPGDSFNEPDRFRHATYSNGLRDLTGVLAELRGGGLGVQPTAIGVLGHSMGGGLAALQTAADPGITALVTWSATARLGRLWRREQIPEWRRSGALEIVNQRTGERLPLATDILDDLERNAERLDVLAAAATVRAPWLVVHGDADESVPSSDARDLVARAPQSRLLMVPNAGHTFGIKHPWGGSTPQFDQVLEASVDWFSRHLLA